MVMGKKPLKRPSLPVNLTGMKRLPALLLAALFALPVAAVEKPDQARLRLPWEALKSVLRIDQDRVRLSADEFDALVKLTSRQRPPDHVVADGDVLLSRAEFTRLIQSLIPPAAPAATVFVPKASYRGRLSKSGATIEASLHIEVTQKPAKPLEWDAFPAQAAFQEISLDGKAALAVVRDGRLFVTLTEAGDHRLDLRFSVPVPDSNAGQTLGLALATTPITEWIFEIPEPNLDIAVSGALYREISGAANATRVRALLPPTSWVTMAWNPLAPDRAKGPAQVFAVVDHLLSVEEDAVRVQSHVSLDVLQNTINEVVLIPPTGFAVLDVNGEAVKDWTERTDPARLTVALKSARKGNIDLFVTLERVLPGEKSTTTFSGVSVIGAQRQRGHLGVELKSDVELPAPAATGLEPKDPFRELPPDLVARSHRLVYGYKHVGGPFALALSLSRHATVNVPQTFVDRVEGTTVVRPDGKRVHRATFWVQSSARQFLGLSLPPRAALWSVFVDNAPVKPVAGPDQKTMIPLIRASRSPAGLFPVEIVLYEEKSRLPPLGRDRIRFPLPDLLVNRLQWSVVVPPDQRFRYFGRDFEDLNKRPADVGAVQSAATVGAEEYKMNSPKRMRAGARADKLSAMNARESLADGFAMEKSEVEFDAPAEDFEPPPAPASVPIVTRISGIGGGMVAGVLPVRVNVPETGTWLTFSKTLPPTDGTLVLPLWHWSAWVGESVRWILMVAGLGLLWLLRAPLTARARRPIEKAAAGLKSVRLRPTPFGAMFLALTVALAAALVARPLFAPAVLLYAFAVVRWALSLLDPTEGE